MADRRLAVEHPAVRGMSEEERAEASTRVAVATPAQLKGWLRETGRQWLVFNAMDLVDSLPWPEGVDSFMQFVECYRDHRSLIPSSTGEVVKMPDLKSDPRGRKMIEVPKGKPEVLELDELDSAIRYLINQAKELDPTWSLEPKETEATDVQ